MMRIQGYLRERGLDEHLTGALGIQVKRHRTLQNLVLLKYNQIASPMGDPMVQECRGVILDEADDWRVVARPYDKFFNAGEGHAAPLDWSTARVYDKLDGSLMTLYFYGGAWRVASSGTPDASGPAYPGRTFADLFFELYDREGRSPLRHCCYMFELCHPRTQVVVRYEEPRLVLHGARNLLTMEELEPEDVAAQYGWACVANYPLGSLEEVLAAASQLSPAEGEGYVVRDAAFRRLKVKSLRYVAVHHAKDGLTPRGILSVVQTGEASEVLAYFPELKVRAEEMRAKFDGFVAEVEADYAAMPEGPDMKAFALEAVKRRTQSALFALKRGKTPSARAFVSGMQVDKLLGFLGYEVSEEGA